MTGFWARLLGREPVPDAVADALADSEAVVGTPGRCTTDPVVAPSAPAALSALRVAGPVVYRGATARPTMLRAIACNAEGNSRGASNGRAATAASHRCRGVGRSAIRGTPAGP